MKKVNELRGLLKIDKNNLDEAVQRQPLLYYEVAQKHALAASQRDQLYDEVKFTDAQLNLHHREEMLKDNLKPTEAQVSARVLESDEHGAAVSAYMKSKLVADELLALKEAFQQRSYMLRELVELYVSGYYGSDSIQPKRNSRDGTEHKIRRVVNET